MQADNATILIKLASYRDSELVPTIQSALRMAEHPERLRFAIVNQVGPETAGQLASLSEDHRVSLYEVDWKQSLGLGWARNLCDKMWRGEDFSLQLDSHMRFRQSWDDDLVADWLSRDEPNAVLSCYPAVYELGEHGETFTRVAPHKIVVDGVTDDGVPLLKSGERVDPHEQTLLVAGGFQFAPGRVSEECPNHPRIYTGDETAHSLALFTHGYTVYSPKRVGIYHLYNRQQYMKIHLWTVDLQEDLQQFPKYGLFKQACLTQLRKVFDVSQEDHAGAVRTKRAFWEKLLQFRDPAFSGELLTGNSATEGHPGR